MKLCVFTTLFGRYEPLNEQPVAARSTLPFICLTDDPELESQSWQVRRVEPLFGMDPIRSQRDVKIRPYAQLAEFDGSLYIDNSVILSAPPEDIWARYIGAAGFSVPRHSFRDTVMDEFLVVAHNGIDDSNRVFEQLNHYSIVHPAALAERPLWSAVLLRDHRNAQVRQLSEIWAAHVLRYSRRDQLSLNVALHEAGLTPDVMEDVDNHHSWFHSWPHTKGRHPAKGPRLSSASLEPQPARLRQLESEIERLTRLVAEHEGGSSHSLRLLRRLARRFLRLARRARLLLGRMG